MSQDYRPSRRSRLLPWLAAGLLAGGVLVAVLTEVIVSHLASSPDYRDAVTLARAVKDAKGAQAASCARAGGDGYICAVSRSDGTEGIYRVTVSPDGRSWSAG